MNKEFITIDENSLESIKEIYTEFMNETNTGRPDNFDVASSSFVAQHQGYISLLIVDRKQVGFVEYRVLPKKLRDNQNITEITSLFVREQYRHLGYGVELVNFVRLFAKQNNCYSLVLYSGLELENAHRFYEKIGFNKSAYFFKLPV